MADEQDRPDQPSQTPPPAAEPPASEPPPAKHTGAKAAKKAPAKAAKKAPAKAAKAAKAAKGAKAAPKKAAKKALPPPPKPEPTPRPPIAAEPQAAATLADTNGDTRFGAADETAAQARQAVDTAGDSLGSGISRVPGTGGRVPIAVALAMALLAILLIRRLLSDDQTA